MFIIEWDCLEVLILFFFCFQGDICIQGVLGGWLLKGICVVLHWWCTVRRWNLICWSVIVIFLRRAESQVSVYWYAV